jgi:hypothetical protein
VIKDVDNCMQECASEIESIGEKKVDVVTSEEGEVIMKEKNDSALSDETCSTVENYPPCGLGKDSHHLLPKDSETSQPHECI